MSTGMYNLTTLAQEARQFGVKTLLPDINRSGIRYDLEAISDRLLAIRKPLTSIAELNATDAAAIALERLGGAFTSVEDFYCRVELPIDVLKNIARSGAFNALARNSRSALWEIGVLERRLRGSGKRESLRLFDLPAMASEDLPVFPELTEMDRLQWDYQTHGSARRHPMSVIRRTLNDFEIRTTETARRFTKSPDRPHDKPLVLTVAGIVILRQTPPTANGCMFITLEDESSFVQTIALPQVRERLGDLLRSSALIVRGTVEIYGNWRGITIRDAWALDLIGGYEGYASAWGGGRGN